MNRHQRRAAAAKARPAIDRATLFRRALEILAGSADTATGMTIIMADGEVSYISRETADAMAGNGPAGGHA
jgi:hypothetical protein